MASGPVPNRWPRCTSRAASTTSAPSRRSKISCGLWDSTSGEISPDRLDALVWAVTELRVDAAPVRLITSDSGRNPHIRGPQLQTNAALSGWLRDLLGRDSARRTPTSDRADGGPSAMNEDDHATHETAD